MPSWVFTNPLSELLCLVKTLKLGSTACFYLGRVDYRNSSPRRMVYNDELHSQKPIRLGPIIKGSAARSLFP